MSVKEAETNVIEPKTCQHSLRKTKFCPHCGVQLQLDPLEEILQHVMKTIKAKEEERKNAKDAKRHGNLTTAIIKWKSWEQALRKALERDVQTQRKSGCRYPGNGVE